MFGKKRNSESAGVPAVADESPHNLAALEAEYDAYQTAGENEEEWDGRDPKVIEAELDAARDAERLASDLNTSTAPNITRKEFEEFKVAVAAAVMGIEAAQRDQLVRPHDVPNLLSANAAAIGLSRGQAKAVDDFQHMLDVVKHHYGNWDQRTASQRAYAAREAALRRPPRFG